MSKVILGKESIFLLDPFYLNNSHYCSLAQLASDQILYELKVDIIVH